MDYRKIARIDGENLIISKEELKRLKHHYYKVAKIVENKWDFLDGYYDGKYDVFVDMLKLFDDVE